MSLARCPNPECDRILDVPEIPASWRAPDGRCAQCNNMTKEAFMHIPENVLTKFTAAPPSDLQVMKVQSDVPVSAYRIDSNVKMPTRRSPRQYDPRTSVYPFSLMKPPRPDGSMDSFFAPLGDDKKKVYARIYASIKYFKKVKNNKATFAMRHLPKEKGIRVWRTK